MPNTDLFADILKPTPTPPKAAVEVARSIPSHHPESPKPSRTPQTSRLGLPPTRQNPWARSGRTLQGAAATDPAEAMRQSGLDWTVSRVDLRAADTLDAIPDFAAIRRSDTNGILGVVGPDYEPFQNAGMFQVFSDLAQVDRGDGGLPFEISTAGAFQGGKVVWALTKRAERLSELAITWPQNAWVGVTVEHQDYLHRIDLLRQVDAPVRWLSVEPLLSALSGLDLKGIDWVVVGGESGPRARPMEADWARGVRDTCLGRNTAFFFKQWGGRDKKKAGRVLDGRTWDEMPLDYATWLASQA